MTTFSFELDNLNITVEGTNDENIVETLQRHNLGALLHNQYYFSRSVLNKTGNGWLRLKDMNDVFIVNAFVARLSETLKAFYKNMDTETSEPDLYYNLLSSIIESIGYSGLDDMYNNKAILEGLVYELTRRLDENSEFDEVHNDVIQSVVETDDGVSDNYVQDTDKTGTRYSYNNTGSW